MSTLFNAKIRKESREFHIPPSFQSKYSNSNSKKKLNCSFMQNIIFFHIGHTSKGCLLNISFPFSISIHIFLHKNHFFSFDHILIHFRTTDRPDRAETCSSIKCKLENLKITMKKGILHNKEHV